MSENDQDNRSKKRGKTPTADYVEPYIYWHDRKEKTYKVNFYMAIKKGSQPISRQRSGIKGIMEARRVVIEFRNELTKQKERQTNGDKKWKDGRTYAYKKILEGSKNTELSRDEYNTRTSLEKHTAVWDNFYMTEISQQMVSDLINSLYSLEPATKNKIRQHISRIYQINGFKIDPAKQIKIRGYRKTNKRRLAGLTRDEMRQLIAYAKEKSPNEFGILIEIAYFSACRSGELYALEWSDFKKNENGQYFLEIRKSYNWYEKRIKAPKNNEMRRIGLSNKIAAKISELKLRKLDEKYIIPRIKDWEHGQASKILRKYLQDLAIIPSNDVIKKELAEGAKNPKYTIRFHDLRGISITHSLTSKEDLNAVMERVGHKSMSTTSLYLKKIEDHQNIAIANNLDFPDEIDESTKVVELKKSRS